MNKKQKELLTQCETVDICDNVPALDEILIVPTTKVHDSGFKIMNVIGCAYGANFDTKKFYLLDTWSDVVNFGGLFSKAKLDNINIDIKDNGIIRLWSRGQKFISTFRCSSCAFDLVKSEELINNEQ